MKGLWTAIIILSVLTAKAQNPEEIDSLVSNYDDVSPVLSPDGNRLYFSKAAHPENSGGERDKGDIWMSKKVDGKWTKAKRLSGPINNDYYNAPIGITPDGGIMYVVGNYESHRKGGVSFSRKIGESWSEPKAIDIPYFKNKSDHLSGSLSPDGKIMVLSLESYTSEGNEDIYYSFRKRVDEWTELRNLGDVVNTKYQELTPYLASDNKTLFFSANGRGGKGSRDIFYTKRLDATWTSWTEPKNVESFNSEGADWYFRLIDEAGNAVMVNTVNSVGLGNVMTINLPEDIVIDEADDKNLTASTKPEISVTPMVEETKKPNKERIDVFFEVYDGVTGKQLYPQLIISGINEITATSFSERVLNAGSDYKAKVYKDSIYSVNIMAEGYLEDTQKLRTDTVSSDQPIIFELVSLEKGTTIQLNSVLFRRGTAELFESSFEELDRVVKMLKNNPEIEIELSGHTDNTGSAKLNVELSQKRADRVKEYLIDKGIVEKRIDSKGYGGARPIASNKSEKTRRLNRRVEFTIIKN